MEIMLDIGQGLKIAKVHVDELKEQDVNARTMDKKMFERLTANIQKDKRLESLPFCAQAADGLQIVSGHHRVRASRSAGITEIYIILDDTGLDKNKIRSKQLSHNSLQGVDNEQLVREIYAMIDDAEQKLAAFIDPNLELTFEKAQIKDIVVDFDIKTVLVSFLSYQQATFERAAQMLDGKYDKLYVADLQQCKPFMEMLKRLGKEYDVRSMSTTFTKMAEIALEHLGEEQVEGERVAVRDIIGTAYIPPESAETLKKAIEKMKKKGDITAKNRWQALEYLAAEYLGGE